METVKKQGLKNDEGSRTPEVVKTTPAKRNNSHMSPPDKNVQTNITILSPEIKDLFINSIRKEIQKKNDGYDTEDEIPLSQLREVQGKGKEKNQVTGTNMNNSIVIDEDAIQTTANNNNTRLVKAPIRALEKEVNTEGGSGDGAEQVNREDPITLTVAANQDEIDPQREIDPQQDNDVNKEQLIADDPNREVLGKLLQSIENINKKLEKLDVVESEVKQLNEKSLKKEDVENIIQSQLIPVKTTLMNQEVKMRRQQNEMAEMNKRLEKRIEELENKLEKQDGVKDGLQKKEVEEMIAKANTDQRREINDQETSKGKSNRNLVIHGVEEDRNYEDIAKVQDLAYEMGLNLHR